MIYFKNPGLIPLQAITTMGVNVKEFAGAIGHFGTGLKITIAGILRTGGSIVIYRGKSRIGFSTVTEEVRGKPFEFIVMEPEKGIKQRLGMTTELGKNWAPWMFMRELESNCRDERGQSSTKEQLAEDGHTLIVVSSQLIENEYNNRDRYFIDPEEPPVYEHPKFDLYRGETNKFFYHGIKVGEFSRSLPFKVNIKKDLTNRLTEDRTMQEYYAQNVLEAGIPEIKDPKIIEEFFPDIFEATHFAQHWDWDQNFTDPSEAFFERMKHLNQVNYLCVPPSAVKMMISHNQFDKYERTKVIEMDAMEEKMLERAKVYLTDLGYVREEIDQWAVKKAYLGKEVLALADSFLNTIFISPTVFDMGQKAVCSTLHEEFLHLNFRFFDCSREMQQHLFDRLATIMEKHCYKMPL